MRAEEFLSEAQMSPDIKKIMTKQGYKYIAHGQDQDAYFAPDGTILKIFGYERDSRGFSEAQQSFIDYANFCMKNPNNPFLPQFGGWQPFEFNGQKYLQIKCERLFPLKQMQNPEVFETLSGFIDDISAYGYKEGVEMFLEGSVDDEYSGNAGAILITLLGGKKELTLFAKTIDQLDQIANQKNYTLDLHSNNFMLGSDGELVINDPFFTGSYRS